MEQTIIDFFAKASELILHNRLISSKTLEAVFNLLANLNPLKFQLSFDQKFNFNAKIPPQWNTQNNKLLVLEFFLSNKTTKEKFLVEQWAFELNQVPDGKLKYTIDSPSTLYKKLSILLRSISVLTTSLPLYKNFLADKNNRLWEYYALEHSINFTRHTLSNWHFSVHEENNLASYTNPDLVLPGRTFAFKISYPQSLKFLLAVIDDELNPESKHIRIFKEKLDEDYFAPNRRSRGLSGGKTESRIRHTRKRTLDDTKLKFGDEEDLQSDGEGGDDTSLTGSILTASPIQTQKSPVHSLHSEELKPRKDSGDFMPCQGKIPTKNPRKNSTDSQSSEEYDIQMHQDADGQVTEIVSVEQINLRKSLKKFNLPWKQSEGDNALANHINGFEAEDLQTTVCATQVEKILEPTDDDQLAEMIQAVEDLKNYCSILAKDDPKNKILPASEDNKKADLTLGGAFKFHIVTAKANTKSIENEESIISSDYGNLAKLYSKLIK